MHGDAEAACPAGTLTYIGQQIYGHIFWTENEPASWAPQPLPRLSGKRSDTVGELVGYAASAAKREMRVGASGRPANQAATRSRLRAAAVATCCRRVLARPR